MKTQSGPIQLLSFVWRHSQEATGHSWLKLNHAMHEALFLALRSGMEFRHGDIEYMAKEFRSGYWSGDWEAFYRTAVIYRNASAWQEFEVWRGRKAFIVRGASIHINTGDGPAGNGLERLVVGAEFRWKGEKVTVSSFNDDKKTFIACSYQQVGEQEICGHCQRVRSWPTQKLLHRYTISHQDIRHDHKQAERTA